MGAWQKFRAAHGMAVVTGVFVTLVVITLARLSYGVMLPFMKEGMHISYGQAAFLGTATSLGYLCTVLQAGMLAAKWGNKKAILLGLGCVTFSFINLGFSSSYLYSMGLMLLLGVGTAFTFTPLISLLTMLFPARKGLVIGLVNGGTGIGMVFAGITIPALGEGYPELGWRIGWWIFGAIGIVVLVKALIFLPKIKANTKVVSKLIPPKRIYRNRNLNRIALIYGVVGITYIIQSVFMMSYMMDEGLGSILAGKLISINGILSIISAPFWGAISDKVGRKNALIIVMGLNLAGTLAPVIFPTPFTFVINNLVIGIIATGLFTMVQALSTEQASIEDSAICFSYTTFFFAVGQLIGPTLAGWLIEYGGGFKATFTFSAMFMVVGLFLSMRMGRKVVVEEKGAASLD